uniref:Uncharacterized protein n=1 Tax=Leptobrachium leishanense TaxID=445787 RepID=A0A8C5Q1Q3_9ANUR
MLQFITKCRFRPRTTWEFFFLSTHRFWRSLYIGYHGRCNDKSSGGPRVHDFPPPALSVRPGVNYAALDFLLDQINFCLDHLEEKNDHLNAQLQDLLESNRQARRDFQQQFNQGGANKQADLHMENSSL